MDASPADPKRNIRVRHMLTLKHYIKSFRKRHVSLASDMQMRPYRTMVDGEMFAPHDFRAMADALPTYASNIDRYMQLTQIVPRLQANAADKLARNTSASDSGSC